MNILDLLRTKVEPTRIRKASGAKGGEWHSPCPLCGGTDRFSVFPEQEGGELCQKYGLLGTWACVRGCGKGGDLISWFTEIEGLTFKAACAELKIPMEGADKVKRGYRPLRMPQRAASSSFEPQTYAEPAEKWRQSATKLAIAAKERLLQTTPILKYLAARGLSQEAVDRYGLGYIEGEKEHPECLFRPRASYGLPPKIGKEGKQIRAFRIPRGITIPAWSDSGQALRIRIRRRDIDRDKSNPRDPKYLLVPQPDQPYSAPLLLPPEGISPDLATWVVTEAELDAMAIHHACAGKVGAISILTAKGKPDRRAHGLLTRSARILVALDADEDKDDGSNPGAEGWRWWKQTYPQARLWPVPEGKDPGEAYSLGIDLAEWISAGLPGCVSLSSTKSEPADGILGACSGMNFSGEGATPDPFLDVVVDEPAVTWTQMATEDDFDLYELAALRGALEGAGKRIDDIPLDVARLWLLWRNIPAVWKKDDRDFHHVGPWANFNWQTLSRLTGFRFDHPVSMDWLELHPADEVTPQNLFKV